MNSPRPARRSAEDPRIAQAAKLLALYMREGRTRTDILKDIATIIADLRTEHTLADGRPDLGGRSPQYRAIIRDIYSRAKVSADDADGVQTALRYHVNNRLHELRGADELAAAGLSDRPAKERLGLNRDAVRALADALTDPAKLAVHIDELVHRIEPAELIDGEGRRARAARQALESAERRIYEIVTELNAAQPRRSRSRKTG